MRQQKLQLEINVATKSDSMFSAFMKGTNKSSETLHNIWVIDFVLVVANTKQEFITMLHRNI